MSVDSYRSELTRLDREIAALNIDLGKQEEALSKARAEGDRKRRSAVSTKSVSTAQSYLRSAESEDKKVVAAQKKIGEIRTKLASKGDRRRTVERNLESALKSARTTQDRQDEQRRRKEKDHARDVARLSSSTVRHVFVREPEPEKLRVLYLTASPVPVLADNGGSDGERSAPLRVDAEVNNVLKALRGAKHRDAIELFIRPAAAVDDLVNGINDHRPHVIHFSGHGATSGLQFDTASLAPSDGLFVGFPQLARLLAATNFPPTLMVLNSCESIGGAEALLETAPVIIAMSDAVGDMAAGLFATHFYAAIGSAQSIGHAVKQAKAMIEIALPDEEDRVTICARQDVDVDELHLVKANTFSATFSLPASRLGYTGSP